LFTSQGVVAAALSEEVFNVKNQQQFSLQFLKDLEAFTTRPVALTQCCLACCLALTAMMGTDGG
jgi:hypothetical protein